MLPFLYTFSCGYSVTGVGLWLLPYWRTKDNQIHLQKCGLQHWQILHYAEKLLATTMFQGE
jgi:hypothetical protein